MIETYRLVFLVVHGTLRFKIAQKPYIIWPLGPKTLKSETLEP